MRNNSFVPPEEVFETLQSFLRSYHADFDIYYEELCKRMIIRYIAKGGIVITEGQICDSMYFLVRGFCFCYYVKNGRESIMEFFGGSELAFVFHSFFERRRSCLNMKTAEDTTFLALRYADFRELSDRFPAFKDLIFRIQLNRLVKYELRRPVFHCYTAEERILYFVRSHELQNWMQHIPQYRIASWLNMAPETFAKIWGQLDLS